MSEKFNEEIKREIGKKVEYDKDTILKVAQDGLEKYFKVKVSTNDKQIKYYDPNDLVESKTNKPIYEGIGITALSEGEPKINEIRGFEARINPDSNEILRLSVDKHVKGNAKDTVKDEEGKNIAIQFIKENKLIENIDSMKFIERTDEKGISSFKFEYDQNKTMTIVINSLKEVISFIHEDKQ
ncbi:hypothetical protein CLPU_12c00290 [Gottschalkia purinilytica]|uniref:Uncharacterized protein n=1 Tax=Gottschalkia purinilytica TaxID=1503 RepID=A0A0L0W8I0_GOTPU|nr:hypothetical protein [Gottschalkia purinilytica]KNF07756.1 hypothetical protein CLPU_12c00290 [Gottschalkia purinilytica]